MLTVFRPRVFAKAITHRPTPELAAFCTTHSPGCRSTYSLSRSAAVGGFIASIANCCGSASAGRAERPPADMTIRSLQVKLEGGARTRSPTFSTPRPYSQHLADPFIADDGWKRGAECVDALCDHEVVRVDGGILDADQDLVWAGSVGLGNVDALKTVDRVAKSCELNSAHWFLLWT